MRYEVLTRETGRVIRESISGLNVNVMTRGKVLMPDNSAYCIATQYMIKGGFVPEHIFLFSAPAGTALETLKNAVDFYFRDFLKTELYVKEVPTDSSLFAEEALRLYGKNENEMNDGTVSSVCAGGTK
jgi:hypothetical protein